MAIEFYDEIGVVGHDPLIVDVSFNCLTFTIILLNCCLITVVEVSVLRSASGSASCCLIKEWLGIMFGAEFPVVFLQVVVQGAFG